MIRECLACASLNSCSYQPQCICIPFRVCTVSCSADTTIKLWSFEGFECLKTLHGEPEETVESNSMHVVVALYTYTYMYMYACICKHVCMYICTCIHLSVYMCVCVCMYVHAFISLCKCMFMFVRVHACLATHCDGSYATRVTRLSIFLRFIIYS